MDHSLLKFRGRRQPDRDSRIPGWKYGLDSTAVCPQHSEPRKCPLLGLPNSPAWGQPHSLALETGRWGEGWGTGSSSEPGFPGSCGVRSKRLPAWSNRGVLTLGCPGLEWNTKDGLEYLMSLSSVGMSIK